MILAYMTLIQTDVTDAAVPMLEVLPMHEAERPGASVFKLGKAPGWGLGPVFRSAKQRFRHRLGEECTDRKIPHKQALMGDCRTENPRLAT